MAGRHAPSPRNVFIVTLPNRPSRHGRTYAGQVRIQRQVVDYALARRSVLAEVSAGRTDVKQVCDADPYLLRAAKFHGRGSDVVCPICRKEQLTLVSWVFGDKLGQVSGSARTSDELARLAETAEEFTVHVVEVCRTCSWNHLVQSYSARDRNNNPGGNNPGGRPVGPNRPAGPPQGRPPQGRPAGPPPRDRAVGAQANEPTQRVAAAA
eukprot:gene22412-26880_t